MYLLLIYISRFYFDDDSFNLGYMLHKPEMKKQYLVIMCSKFLVNSQIRTVFLLSLCFVKLGPKELKKEQKNSLSLHNYFII